VLAAVKEMYNAEDADQARAAITAFERDYGAKFPKAAEKIVDDADLLTAPATTRRSIGPTCVRRAPSSLVSRQCVAEQGHQGAGLADGRARDGVQAGRDR
jgi:hypothetical protein